MSKVDQRSVYEDLAHVGTSIPSTRKRTASTTVRELLQISASSSMNPVGIGHIDPFEVYPSELPMHVVSPVLARLTQALVQTFPPEGGSLESSVANMLYRKCLTQRVLFHALLYSQFVRMRLSEGRQSNEESPEMIYCHLEAVKGINQSIQRDPIACSDDTMLAVLALAVSGPAANIEPRRSPSQGPLKALQALDVYGGALETVAPHAAGVMKMVAMRGGLKNLKLPGLPQQLSYADVIKASRDLTRPLLRFVSFNPGIELHLSAVSRQLHSNDRIGRGFTMLRKLLPRKRVNRLYPVLRRLCSYTLAIHDYVECTPDAQSIGLMSDERNYAQHCLMSLNVDDDLVETEQEYALSKLCQFSATIYSLLIVFPLPPTTAPFATLARQLKEQLSKLCVNTLWDQAPQLMLWIAVMGAISAIGTRERSSYVSMLVRPTRRLKMNNWVEMKDCLQDFLWFGSTSDVDGADLWKEVQLVPLLS